MEPATPPPREDRGSGRGGPDVRGVELETDDGVTLAGDLAAPPGARAAAVLCHPHPQYGGTRFDAVVTSLFETLAPAGVAALRFDFRREFGGGIDEIADARAAVDELHGAVPAIPLVVVGYSFGAMVTLSLDHPTVVAKALIAPPLGAMPMTGPPPGSARRILVLTPAHDQFCPPSTARRAVAGWGTTDAGAGTELDFEPGFEPGFDVDFEVVESTDHSLAGRRRRVAERVCDWVLDLVGPDG